jgi:hypothetical protein
MVQLLSGGQALSFNGLSAAGGVVADHTISKALGDSSPEDELQIHAARCCYVLSNTVMFKVTGSAAPEDQQQFSVLSAAAVRLALELQLLAAAEHQQREQELLQQEGGSAAGTAEVVALLASSARLLHILIKAVTQASSSCLPPEVLQQAGLQLLQALAAPLQQLQLSNKGWLWENLLAACDTEHIGAACHALVTAACGPATHGVAGEFAA